MTDTCLIEVRRDPYSPVAWDWRVTWRREDWSGTHRKLGVAMGRQPAIDAAYKFASELFLHEDDGWEIV